MRIADLTTEYQAKSDEELLCLAMDSEHLTSEAKASLTAELAKREISPQPMHCFRGEEEQRTAGPRGSKLTGSAASATGSNSYMIGPPLAAEAPKAPWRPKTAGRIAFFFGPLAGAQVVAISLRRMGHQQTAKKVMLLALGMAALEAAILFFIPDVWSRLVGFGAEIAFLLIFPIFMETEFRAWEAEYPNAIPANGWSAVGWGFLGILVFFAVAFVVFSMLAALFPTSAT